MYGFVCSPWSHPKTLISAPVHRRRECELLTCSEIFKSEEIFLILFNTLVLRRNNLISPAFFSHPKWSLKVCAITGNCLSQLAELPFHYGPCLSVVTMAIAQSSVLWSLWDCQQPREFSLWIWVVCSDSGTVNAWVRSPYQGFLVSRETVVYLTLLEVQASGHRGTEFFCRSVMSNFTCRLKKSLSCFIID